MKEESSALEVDIKIMSAVIGCLSTIRKVWYTDLLSFLEDQILQHSIVKEGLSTLLVEMMQKVSTMLVRNMIFRMTLGLELLI